jgi:hypothetical protein
MVDSDKLIENGDESTLLRCVNRSSLSLICLSFCPLNFTKPVVLPQLLITKEACVTPDNITADFRRNYYGRALWQYTSNRKREVF